MTQVNDISVLTIIPTLFFFFSGLLNGGHEVATLYNCVGGIIIKSNLLLLSLIIFTLLVTILQMKVPCNINVIEIGVPLLIIFVADHGVSCHIFGV